MITLLTSKDHNDDINHNTINNRKNKNRMDNNMKQQYIIHINILKPQRQISKQVKILKSQRQYTTCVNNLKPLFKDETPHMLKKSLSQRDNIAHMLTKPLCGERSMLRYSNSVRHISLIHLKGFQYSVQRCIIKYEQLVQISLVSQMFHSRHK